MELEYGILRMELNVERTDLTKICWAPDMEGSCRGGWVKAEASGVGPGEAGCWNRNKQLLMPASVITH